MAGAVLVVDDDPSLARSLRDVLEGYDLTLDAAEDAQSARTMLDSGDYCGMVLDLVLPDGTGFDVLRYTEEKSIDVSIVVVSQKLPSYVREILSETRVKLVFPKPADPRILAAVVLGMCGIQR